MIHRIAPHTTHRKTIACFGRPQSDTTRPVLTDLASASQIWTALKPSRAVTTFGALPVRIASSM